MTKKTIHFFDKCLPPTLSNTVKIGYAPISQIEQVEPETILSDKENVQWRGFESQARRREFAATRWLVHQMVRQLPINEKAFELKKDELEKPYGFCKGREYPVSIAHTREQVLCGLSLVEPLGVDLEPVDRKVPEKLRNRILNSTEKPLLEEEPTLRLWTIKEALVKLQGKGMRTNLHSCTITGTDGTLFIAKFNNDKTAKICSFKQHKNWMAFAWNK